MTFSKGIQIAFFNILTFYAVSTIFRPTCIGKYTFQMLLSPQKHNQCFKMDCFRPRIFTQWDFAAQQMLVSTFPVDSVVHNYVREVRNVLFSYVKPTPLEKNPLLAAVSDDVLINIMDIDPSSTNNSKFLDFASGNGVLAGTEPVAHRYGGHQFGYWAGQLGDGRAVMLGEYVNSKGERWELQLKGSGLTPYSRQGDGRAVIRSSLREFLCSEAMHALGIPTSRAASLVVSSEPVIRDQFYNGNFQRERAAVVLRLAKSWFRIGSLEILAEKQETSLLRKLTDFIITNYFPNINITDPDRHLSLYQAVVEQTADMIALWQSVGFTHGVCNTDNFSILSITIDYGPFGFLEEYNPRFVPNTSDDEGRYSYEKQPDIGIFNLEKLKVALHAISNKEQIKQMSMILKGYVASYKLKFMELFCKKLGIVECRTEDEQLVAVLLKIMEDTRADFTMTFREISEIDIEELVQFAKHGEYPDKFWTLNKLANHEWYKDWCQMYVKRLPTNKSDGHRRRRMQRVNPKYILRNWIAQQAIGKTEKNDFSEVRFVLEVLQNPYVDNHEANIRGFASESPKWAKKLRVSCSS